MCIEASAYDDIEWINKLVDYVARVTTVKPKLKFIGASSDLGASAPLLNHRVQASASGIRS